MFVRKSTYNDVVEMLEEAESKIVELTQKLHDKSYKNTDLIVENKAFRLALEKILAQETKAPNSTVKRIMNIVRKALK